jgi:hypothetical protein
VRWGFFLIVLFFFVLANPTKFAKSETDYANPAKTWLTLAGDLDVRLKSELKKKAG